MQNQVCCVTLTDGSGASAASSSPNHGLEGWIGGLPVARNRHDDCVALPAGHPVSWGLLTAGTLLEGSAFADLR